VPQTCHGVATAVPSQFAEHVQSIAWLPAAPVSSAAVSLAAVSLAAVSLAAVSLAAVSLASSVAESPAVSSVPAESPVGSPELEVLSSPSSQAVMSGAASIAVRAKKRSALMFTATPIVRGLQGDRCGRPRTGMTQAPALVSGPSAP
jgi:hypothetical protein